MNRRLLYTMLALSVAAVLGWLTWGVGQYESVVQPSTAVTPSEGEPSVGAELLAHATGNSPEVLQAISAGTVLYAEHCAACHGARLEGQPNWRETNSDGTMRAPPHDDSGHTWHHDDQTLFNYTKLGGQRLMAKSGVEGFKSGMPGFGGTLTDEQIRQTLVYIKSQWSPRSQKVQRERSRAARELERR